MGVGRPRLGVGGTLVAHCERYLQLAVLPKVKIEYFYIKGHESSEQLRTWYEQRLGYKCFSARYTGRSYRGNEVAGEVYFRHAEKALDTTVLLSGEPRGSEAEIFATRRMRLARYLLEGRKASE